MEGIRGNGKWEVETGNDVDAVGGRQEVEVELEGQVRWRLRAVRLWAVAWREIGNWRCTTGNYVHHLKKYSMLSDVVYQLLRDDNANE